ncbi:MAG: fumarylacetoacetate hydrolase family protein [Deltaproteobacteria bacterium]|nr:fumarylacetoacetate hydrolase family protein [Deltaproteobacteria bacterium]
MRLVTFDHAGRQRLGADSARGLVDFSVAAPDLPGTMLAFLGAGATARQRAAAAVARAQQDGTGLVPAGATTPAAPLPRPGKIFGIALNYRDHAAETGQPIPAAPLVFSKAVTAVIAAGAPIVVPAVSAAADYEGELAVVIGRTARRVPATDALGYVAGYTIMNDVTARDYQARSGHCLAKSFDTFAPMGPVIVTADEIPDPGCLEIRTTLNGEVVQHSNTRHLIFSVAVLIEYLSAGVTLEPGDVITTGTPAGVGFRRQPPRFLREGDTVRIEIEQIGALANPVVAV